jgi:hypothetical protein
MWGPASTPGLVVEWLNYQELEKWLGPALAAEYVWVAPETTMTPVLGFQGLWEQRWKVYLKMMAGSCEDRNSALLKMFVDQVLPGLNKYWICRQKICSLVCQSIYWIHNSPLAQYRCPACGTLYRPWKKQPGYWPTNMVYVTNDRVTLHTVNAELAAGSSDGLAHKNQVMIIPVMWPNTSLSELIDYLKAMFLDFDRALLALPQKDRLTFALENLSKTQPHKFFELQQFSPTTKATIDSLNANLSANKVPWQYEHIMKPGYFGVHADASLDLEKPMEQLDFIRAWWLCFWLSQEPSQVSRCSDVTRLLQVSSLVQHSI